MRKRKEEGKRKVSEGSGVEEEGGKLYEKVNKE